MADPIKFHPALAVTNIKNFLSITLDMETGQYTSWAELFKIHAKAFQVSDHLFPSEKAASSKEPATDSDLWNRIDAIVLQWIYGTISNDLLHTILKPNSTAKDAWTRLAEIFQDNKNSRAVHLEHQFSHTYLDEFPNVNAYCQKLKMLADQLANVGAAVSDQRLVLQLVAGLNDTYANVATLIQQSDPLPSFSKARSMLTLEETSMAKRLARDTNSAMFATTNSVTTNDNSHQPRQTNNRNKPKGGRGRGTPPSNRPYGRGGRNGGRGSAHSSHFAPWQPSPWPYSPRPAAFQQPWATPPSPYPTTSWSPRPPTPSPHPGILGPRPQQAHYTAAPHPPTGYSPTDIAEAMHTLSLNPPADNWYMDTGATSHMTSESGSSHGAPPTEM